jgi:opacity protein-like surface antigen
MKKTLAFFFLFSITHTVFAQRFHIGVYGGVAAYNGDLTDKIFPKKVTNGALGITANYELTDNIMLRGGYTYAVVGGADRFSSDAESRARNLAFETALSEFSLVGEYYLLSLYDKRISPYAYAGLAAYHFNPYAYNGTTQKIYLKPLSTEGQGLPGYPDKKPYNLTQFAIPFGGGVKFAVTDNLRIGLEVGFRKLFTDYLDDVSTTYADPVDLLAARGQLAVDMSYRGDDVGNPTYPAKGAGRGGPNHNDTYYFTGLHLTYRLGSGNGGGSYYGGGGGRLKKNSTGCPVNVY